MKFYQSEDRFYPRKLGLRGWGYAGKYKIERYLYFLHRLTGLGILFYLVLHIHVTGYKVRGQEVWDRVMGFLNQPLFHLGEYLLFFAVVFHALNGIRLIVTEFGWALGKPARPIYPYQPAMLHQRPLLIVLMVMTAVIVFLGGIDFFAF